MEPPQLVRIAPDTNALNVRATSVAFQFDEVVSERPLGAPSLADMFEVSPSTGPVRVSWRRTRVEVIPDGGLRPNTTYTVRLLPGMVDLANNVDSIGATVVFSTGETFATGVMEGRVFDWVAARPVERALVEAISLPDSAIYATSSYSLGAFALRHLPSGTYLLRALVDQNRNRFVDPRELFDSITVTLADSFSREMLATLRDSVGPGLSAVDPRDSLLLRLTLDRPLDTAFVAGMANFSLKSADSAVVAMAAVLTQADVDRLATDTARVRALEDSVRNAALTDSIRAADSARVAAIPPARATGRRPGAPTRAPPAAPVDTTGTPIPKPTGRIPVTTLFIRLLEPLRPETAFRLRAQGLVSVTGATRDSERVFTTPKPAARPDTAAPPDTGRRSRD